VRLFAPSLLLFACATARAQPAPPTPPSSAGDEAATAPAVAPPTTPAPLAPPEATAPPASRAVPLVAIPIDTPAPSSPVPPDDWTLRPGAFIQPQFRMRQNAPGAPNDTDGFRFARARLTALGGGHVGTLQIGGYVEAELQPSFSLFDAYVTVSQALPHDATVTVDAGQMRVPISRQQLMSDTRLSFVDKAQLATIAPDRDLGARVTLAMPHARLIAGSFNGEGRDQGQNINESFLTAGRLEITPLGEQAPYAESAFTTPWLSLAVSAGYDKLTPGSFHENETFLGADLSGAWRGLSGTVEYLEVRHHFADAAGGVMLQPDFKANGWVAQLAYLLPMAIAPAHAARVELGARVEAIDRNDTTPIIQIGAPEQSVLAYTAVVSYYLRRHTAKLQLAATHFTELEDRTATGANAAYANDQLLLQLTYRIE